LREGRATGRIAAGVINTKGAASDDLAAVTRLGAGTFITQPFNLPIVIVQVESAIRNKLVKDLLQHDEGGLYDTAYTDPLTGLKNRRYLMERLQEEIDKSDRYGYPVSCVVFDIDDIVPVDDELGPVSLDDLLTEVGLALRNHSRTFDVVARYDGTVFAAVLPHTPLEDAVGYATKIMKEVEATTFSDPNLPTQANLSVGVVSSLGGGAHGNDVVLGEAMRGLFQAKSHPVPRLVARRLPDV
jgi:two-component system cell cycle response regulator